MKIRPVGIVWFHADIRTDRHDEGNSRFRNFANAPKNSIDEVSNSWNRDLLDRLTIIQLFNRFPVFNGAEILLPCSKKPRIGPYFEGSE